MNTDPDDLYHPYHVVRLGAIAALAEELGAEPLRLFDLLRPSLADPHRGVRDAVAHALAHASLASAEVLLALLDAARVGTEAPEGRRARLGSLFAIELAARQSPALDTAPFDTARTELIPLVDHALTHVRFQAFSALEALGTRSDDYTARALAHLQDTDEEVVAVAAEALARCGRTDAIEPLAAATARLHSDPLARASVALSELAAGVTDAEAILQPLRHQLVAQSRRIPHGLRACEALGALGGADAQAHLRKLARSWFVHRLVRVAAAAGLARSGSPEGVELLATLLRHRRRDARGYAIELAGRWGGAALVQPLVAILQSPRDYHSDTAALALALTCAPEADAALLTAAEDPRPDVRLEVARALRQRNIGADVLQRLIDHDPDPEVKLAARAAHPDTPDDDPSP